MNALDNVSLIDLDRELAARSLSDFVRMAWPVLEPGRKLVWGWALDAVCEHLEAVTEGDIRRLIINIPPGSMKSLMTRVFWPAWEWIQRPELKYIGASYAASLALRDNRRAKMLIQSPWFQARWGDTVTLSQDQAARANFENTSRGFMLATSVGGATTGNRADRVIPDDPNNIKEAESDAYREEVIQWLAEVLPTRLNDLDESAIVLVQQRTHERDATGYALEAWKDVTHLCLPMEFESDRRCVTSIGFSDPRTEDGELLWPERFSREAVEDLKAQFRAYGGTYAEAGQLQQRPEPRKGGMFHVEQLRVVRAKPAEVVASVRYWDNAGTDGAGAYTAGVKMSLLADGSYLVEDVRRAQLSAAKRERMKRATAERDGTETYIYTEQEPGSAGKDVARQTIQGLTGYKAFADRVTGDKEERAMPLSAQVEAGNVAILEGEWNGAYLDELRKFPAGRYKDQVDASAGAFAKLQRFVKRDKGTMMPAGDSSRLGLAAL